MTIHTVGTPLKFSEIIAEFGGSAPHKLSDYIRGGALVANGLARNANIPTVASNLKFSQFYGAEAASVISGNVVCTNYVVGPVAEYYSDGVATGNTIIQGPTVYDNNGPMGSVCWATINQAGYYNINVVGGGWHMTYLQVYKNGVPYGPLHSMPNQAYAYAWTDRLLFDAGDTFEIRGYSGRGGDYYYQTYITRMDISTNGASLVSPPTNVGSTPLIPGNYVLTDPPINTGG